MRRSLLLSLIVVCAVSLDVHAQGYNIDFNQFSDFVYAENLGIPGVSFVSNPAQTWFTIDSASPNLQFIGLGGVCLIQASTTGTLDITFSTPVTSVSFSYAQDEDTANTAQLRAEAFNGTQSVGSVTQSPAPPPGGFFVEGFINLVPGASFNRVRISSPTNTLIAIDNIQASGPQLTVISLPNGMLQAAGSGGATDSFTLGNRGSAAASVTLSQEGSFFTQSPTSFSIPAGGTQTVNLTGLMQGPNAFNGFSIVNVSGGQQLRVPVSLLSAVPPSTDSRPVATVNRIDVAADEGQNPTGSVPFRNDGPATIQAIAVSDAPWLIPQSGVITIAPGQTVNVSFTINRSLRRDGSISYGSVFGTLSLRYLTNAPGKTVFSGTGASLVTVVDTTKPKTSDGAVPPLQQGEIALFLTGVGHVTGGGGVRFISDLTIGNAVDTISLGNIAMFFTPREGTTQNAKQSTITSLLPNQAISLADVVKNVYNNDATVGSMQIRSGALQNLSVAASIFNSSDPRGTFGTAIPVLRSDRSITTNGRLVLPGLKQDATHRTNFYLQETKGGTATFRTDFLNAAGQVIGTRNDSVQAFQMLQVVNPAPQGTVTAIVTQTGGTGSLGGYATPLDSASGDTWAVTDWNAAFGSSPTAQSLIPIAGSAAGALGTFFRTDVAATNVGNTTGAVRFTYRPTSGPEVVRDVNLSPNQSFVSTDIVKSLFNVNTDSLGYILVNPLGRSVTVTSRTYTTVSGSSATFGTAVPAIPLTATLALGNKKVIGGLEDASLATLQAGTPATFRTNVDMVETAGAAATVRVTLLFADGRSLAGGPVASKDYALQPNQLFRINRITNDILGAKRAEFGDIRNFQLKFEVVSGSGRVAVTVSSTDNGTGDSILRVE
jgi:hypothetical protein